MPIQITSQPTLISIYSRDATIQMSGNGIRVLDVQASDASISYSSQTPKIQIDQSACFSECGLKNIQEFMADSIAYGQQKIQQGIMRIVEDGNQMAAIENSSDPIPGQAYNNAFAIFDKEFNYGSIPKSRPKIDVIPGDIKYQYQPARIQNNSTPIKVDISYQPWTVETQVRQYGKVNITFDASQLSYYL